MKVVIAGSRDFNNYSCVEEVLDKIPNITEIVSGTYRGADLLSEQYAQSNGIKITRFSAEWDKYGRAAGPVRNQKMTEYADCLIAFWDGKSKGTHNMIKQMQKLHKLVKIIII